MEVEETLTSLIAQEALRICINQLGSKGLSTIISDRMNLLTTMLNVENLTRLLLRKRTTCSVNRKITGIKASEGK